VRVLIVSNLDSSRPFGQYTRPFFLGRGLADLGCVVGHVGVDCRNVDYGPHWSTGHQGLIALTRAVRRALRDFRPDVVYAHQNLPSAAGLLATARVSVPVAADFHALPSVEWGALASSTLDRRVSTVSRIKQVQAAGAERIVARRADVVIAAGDGLAEAIRERLRTAQDPAIVPNGVPSEFLVAPVGEDPYPSHPRGLRAVATIPAGASAANDAALDFLADVAAFLRGASREVSIHVLGTEQPRGLTDLCFEGLVPSITPWLAHADVCLLPYTSDVPLYGGARNKLLEYLALGQRVVTTDEGLRGFDQAGTWEGVHIAPYDPEAFGRAVLAAGQAQTTLQQGPSEVRDSLSWDRGSQQVYGVLSGLVDAS